MKPEDRDDPQLRPAERRFIERLDAAYRPRPLSAARRAALDARVRERLERRGWRPGWGAALAIASAAALLVWVGLQGRAPAPEAGGGLVRQELPAHELQVHELQVHEDWETRLLLGSVGDEALDEELDETPLPPEYAAIESAFFDG